MRRRNISERLQPPRRSSSSGTGILVALILGAAAIGGAYFVMQPPGSEPVPNPVANLLSLRHLSNIGPGQGRIIIWASPRLGGSWSDVVGTAPQGAACDVLESVFILGTRFSKVKVSGRDLTRPDRLGLAVSVSMNYYGTKDDPKEVAEFNRYEAMPDTDPLVGWTRWVAE